MASYSEVASRNSEKLAEFHLAGRRPPVARKTTVRFDFGSGIAPEKKQLIKACADVVPESHIKCIQTLPGNRVDLTLRNEDSVTDIICSGIALNGNVIKPRALGFRTTYVYIQYLPSEMPSQDIGEFMEQYGRVLDFKRQMYDGTSIETGTRIAVMEVLEHIPSFHYIGGYRAKIWHRGQVQTCAFCGDFNHFVKDCPKKAERDDRPQRDDDDSERTVTPEEMNTETSEDRTEQPTEQPSTGEAEESEPLDPDVLPDYGSGPESEGETSSSEYSEESDDEEDDKEPDPEPSTEQSTDSTQANQDQQQTTTDVAVDKDLDKRPVKRALELSPSKTKDTKPKRRRSKKKRPERK